MTFSPCCLIPAPWPLLQKSDFVTANYRKLAPCPVEIRVTIARIPELKVPSRRGVSEGAHGKLLRFFLQADQPSGRTQKNRLNGIQGDGDGRTGENGATARLCSVHFEWGRVFQYRFW